MEVDSSARRRNIFKKGHHRIDEVEVLTVFSTYVLESFVIFFELCVSLKEGFLDHINVIFKLLHLLLEIVNLLLSLILVLPTKVEEKKRKNGT